MNTLPIDSKARLKFPVSAGCYAYFPAALVGVAYHSFMAGAKYNSGSLLHLRWMGAGHLDCIERHCMDLRDLYAAKSRGELFIDMPVFNFDLGKEEIERVSIDTAIITECRALSWRSLALSQEAHETLLGAPLAPAARLKPESSTVYDKAEVVNSVPEPLTVTVYNFPSEKLVSTIKAVRTISGYGLKEAHDLVKGPLPFKVPCVMTTQQEALRELREVGAV